MTTLRITPRVARLIAIGLIGLPCLLSGSGCREAEPEAPVVVDVNHPDITGFEKTVRRQLQDKRAALAALQKRPGVTDAELSRSYGEMGMYYHAYDLYDAAGACYRNARTLAPREFRWRYYLGAVYAKQGDSDSAAASFKQALSIKADDMPAMVGMAQAHLAADRPDQAKPLLERALAKDSNCAFALFWLGRIAMLQHDYQLAVRRFRQALRLQPRATFMHYQLAMAYRNLKQTGQAAEHLAKQGRGMIVFRRPLMIAVKKLRVGMKLHLEAGAAAIRAGRFPEALEELRKAVRADPDNAMPRLSLAAALAKAGDRDGAIREFRELIRMRPRNARAHYWLGALSATPDEAIPHFRKALECDPQHFVAHLGLAEMGLKTGKHELAVTHYKLAVEIDPRHYAPRIGLVVALTEAGRHAEAMASLDKSLKLLPQNMPLTNAAARLLAACPEKKFRNGAKALELAKALFGRQKSIEHAETLAMAFAETGKYEDARKLQNEAIQVETRHNRRDAIPRLKKNLALYKSGKPCRTPW